MKPAKQIGMIVLLAMGCSPSVHAQLPPEMQADRLLVQAERQAREGDPAAALASLEDVLALRTEQNLETPVEFWFRHAEVARIVGDHARAVESSTRYVTAAGRDAEHYMLALEILDASERDLEVMERQREAAEREREADEQAREALARARSEAEARAFSDPLESGGHGPEMVEIPGGEFLMGCRLDCETYDLPLQRVSIQRFALSRREITFAEWEACVADGGCGAYRPDDRGWGRGTRPVILVSWEDAQAYVSWLSSQTNAEYRLPSASEWEYAARAGSDTKYHWGNDVGYEMANCGWYENSIDSRSCGSRWDGEQTAPVGSFEPNGFGLYDAHGNVWEWVEDCNTLGMTVPSDGSALLLDDCEFRARRGGSWYELARFMRSKYQSGGRSSRREFDVGFRVAQTISP